MLAMTKYPRVLKKAQEEVDRVVGQNRLPTFADWENLPYINCCVKEILRWRPVAVNGFPHCLTADVEYKGMLLPKGSTVLLNIWYPPITPLFSSTQTILSALFSTLLCITPTIRRPFPLPWPLTPNFFAVIISQ